MAPWGTLFLDALCAPVYYARRLTRFNSYCELRALGCHENGVISRNVSTHACARPLLWDYPQLTELLSLSNIYPAYLRCPLPSTARGYKQLLQFSDPGVGRALACIVDNPRIISAYMGLLSAILPVTCSR